MKDELYGKIMTKFFGLRAKTFIYLIDDASEDKKTKGTKKCLIFSIFIKMPFYWMQFMPHSNTF